MSCAAISRAAAFNDGVTQKGVNKHDLNMCDSMSAMCHVFVWKRREKESEHRVLGVCFFNLCPHTLSMLRSLNVKRRGSMCFLCRVNFPDCPCGSNKTYGKSSGNKSASCLPSEMKKEPLCQCYKMSLADVHRIWDPCENVCPFSCCHAD